MRLDLESEAPLERFSRDIVPDCPSHLLSILQQKELFCSFFPFSYFSSMPTKFFLRRTARLSVNSETAYVASPWEEGFTAPGGLSCIPNVGAVTQECLAKVGITTQYQLIGQFLMFRKTGDNTQMRCDLMVSFLEQIGVKKALLSVITYALAKKLNRTFPGFFVDSECAEACGEQDEEMEEFEEGSGSSDKVAAGESADSGATRGVTASDSTTCSVM